MNIAEFVDQDSQTQENYTCKDCGQPFDTETGLRLHRVDKHNQDTGSNRMF